MAVNMYKKYAENKTREWPVASGTVAGQVVLHPISNQVGITLTARGDATATQTFIPAITGGTIKIGGVGNKPNTAVVAIDGSWILPVVGVTAGYTNAASGGGTASGTPVYMTAGGTYTLTSSGNTKIGVVDDGNILANTNTPVLLGANL